MSKVLKDFFDEGNHGKKFSPQRVYGSIWVVVDQNSDSVCDCGLNGDDAKAISEALNFAASNVTHDPLGKQTMPSKRALSK